jgi:amino acid transporter
MQSRQTSKALPTSPFPSRVDFDPQSSIRPTEVQGLLDEFQSHGVGYRGSEPDVLPRSSSDVPHRDASQSLSGIDPARSLTYLNGLALVVGLQIGSGIFSSPSAVLNSLGSPGLAMLIWLLAGDLAWTGAASCIELGSIVPLNGGMQEYLRYCYHDICGFLAAWTWVLVVKPCSAAMLSLVFSEYLCRVFAFHENPSTWILKGAALSAIALITFTNCMGTRVSAGTADFFLVCKLLGIGSIIITGLVLGIIRSQHPGQAQNTSVREKS